MGNQGGRTQGKELVESVGRALEILKIMGSDRGKREFGVTEIGRMLGLPKTTVYRLLSTLAESAFVEYNPASSRYGLGWMLFELGSRVPAARMLDDKAKPYLEQLVKVTGETASVAVLDYVDVVYVAKVETENRLKACFPVGSRAPAAATAIGKIQLAMLPEEEVVGRYQGGLARYTSSTITDLPELLKELRVVRERKWAQDEGECTTGICCIAAPISDYTAKVIGGMSIAGPSQRLTQERRAEILPLLQKAAADCSRDLGCT